MLLVYILLFDAIPSHPNLPSCMFLFISRNLSHDNLLRTTVIPGNGENQDLPLSLSLSAVSLQDILMTLVYVQTLQMETPRGPNGLNSLDVSAPSLPPIDQQSTVSKPF